MDGSEEKFVQQPSGPVGSTGFTDQQQAALYYARKRRKQRIRAGNPLQPNTLLAPDTEMGDFK